jgi:hypothetical protein
VKEGHVTELRRPQFDKLAKDEIHLDVEESLTELEY